MHQPQKYVQSHSRLLGLAIAVLVVIHLTLIPEKNISGKGTHSFLTIAVADKFSTSAILVVSVLALLTYSAAKSRFLLAVLVPATFLTLGYVNSVLDGGESVVPLFSYLLIATSGALSGYYLSRYDIEWVRLILVTAATAGAIFSLYQYITDSTYPYSMSGLRGFNDATGERVNRALGLIGEPLATATITMVGLLCTAGWKSRPTRLWITRAILILGLATTFSRGSLFAGLMGAALLIMLSTRFRWATKSLQLISVMIAVWIAVLTLPIFAIRVLRTDDASYTVRAGVLSEMGDAISARIFDPVFGSGAGTNVAIREFFGTPLDNGYLDILVNWGLVGLIALAISIFSSWKLIKSAEQWVFISLAAILANGLTYEFTHYSSAGFLFFFVCAACQGALDATGANDVPCLTETPRRTPVEASSRKLFPTSNRRYGQRR